MATQNREARSSARTRCAMLAVTCVAAFAAAAQTQTPQPTFWSDEHASRLVDARHSERFRVRRTFIEAPNGTSSAATDINNSGLVVGIYNPPEARAFAWSRTSGLVDLEGALPGTFSIAHAVNECGQIVGELNNRAVRWNTPYEVEDLGTLGGPRAFAHGINDRGDVVGTSTIDEGGRVEPFLWTEEHGMRTFAECEPESGGGIAVAINNFREVVGVCGSTGFYWSERTGRVDLRLPGFATSSAVSINDRGEVVGEATTADFRVTPLKWLPRKHRVIRLRHLGNEFSVPWDINQAGWIVGDRATFASDSRDAVVWLTPRRGFAIDPRVGGNSSAAAINDRGSVVATVQFGLRNLRAVLWEPPAIVSRALSKRGTRRCLRPVS